MFVWKLRFCFELIFSCALSSFVRVLTHSVDITSDGLIIMFYYVSLICFHFITISGMSVITAIMITTTTTTTATTTTTTPQLWPRVGSLLARFGLGLWLGRRIL